MCPAAAPVPGCTTWPGALSVCFRTATRAATSAARTCSTSRQRRSWPRSCPRRRRPPRATSWSCSTDRAACRRTTAPADTKIEAARDAAALFYQLIKVGGNRAGLVSFDTNPHVDQGRASVTAALKTTLIGPPPFIARQGRRPDAGQQNVDRRRSEFGKERVESRRRESHGRSC